MYCFLFQNSICFVAESVNESLQELDRFQNSDRCAAAGVV